MRTAVLTHGWRHPQGDDELLSTVSTSKRNHNRFLVLRSQSSHRLARVRAISLCLFLGGAGIRFVPSSSGQLELRETCGERHAGGGGGSSRSCLSSGLVARV